MPLAFNSAYLTVDVTNTEVTALMLYCNVMIFVLFIILLDNLTYNSIYKKTYIGKIKVIMIVLLSYTIIYNSYLANICYSRTAIQQEQTISYFNRMITRIQMLDGYSTELPVAYINDFNKNMESVLVTQIDYQHAYRIKPYNMTSLINNYKWKDFMQLWNGYRPSEVSSEELQRLKELQEVQNMPCYPDDGSIKIIDGAIVIKFNN